MNKYQTSSLPNPLPSWLTFSRGETTVNPDGEAVGSDEVRANSLRTVVGTWGPSQTVYAPTSPQFLGILASGRGLGGTTPLLMCEYVAQGSGLTTVNTLSGEPPVSVNTYVLPRDVMLDTQAVDLVGPGQTGFLNDKAYEPATGTICFGTIVMVCLVKLRVLGRWQAAGTGIAFSTDSGATWTRYFDDTANIKQLTRSRVNIWSCENWYCPHANGEDPPDEVIVPIADYRFAPDEGDNPVLPAGGRVFWFKMKRNANTGQYYPEYISGLPVVAQYTLDAQTYAGTYQAYQHLHSAGIMALGEDKWQIAIAVGDQYCSSIIRIIVNDITTPAFANPANWNVKVNSYGTIDSAITDPAANNGFGGPPANPPGQPANDGNKGNQFVGVAPGPEPETLLVGSDAGGEGIHILRYPSSTLGSPPTHETVASILNFTPASGLPLLGRCFAFAIRTDEPHLKTRTVVASKKVSEQSSAPSPTGLNTIAVSYDSGSLGTWSDVPMTDYTGTGTQTVTYGENVHVIKGYVYLEETTPVATKIVRRQLPSAVTGKPMLIGPGGAQWLVNSPAISSPGVNTVRPCTKDSSGVWLTRNVNNTDGDPLNPQPPVMTNAVYRVSALRGDNDNQLLNLYPAVPNGSTVVATMPTVATETSVFRARAWMLPASAFSADSPQRTAGRSASAGAYDFFWNGGNNSGYYGFCQGFAVHGSTSWSCLNVYTRAGHAANFPENWQFKAIAQGSPSDTDFYLAMGEVHEGAGAFGYPLSPRNSSVSGPTTYPPEKADITGISLSNNWTLLAGGMTPEDSWDQFVPNVGNTYQEFPLFTISDTATNNTVTIAASPAIDTAGGKHSALKMTVRIAGSVTETAFTKEATFMRGRPFLCALVCDYAAKTLSLYSVVNGQYLPVLTISVSLESITMTKIRFGDHQSGNSVVVGAFQWFGFATDSTAYSATQIATQFSNLSFLQ